MTISFFTLPHANKLHTSKRNLLCEGELTGLSMNELDTTSGEVRLADAASSKLTK